MKRVHGLVAIVTIVLTGMMSQAQAATIAVTTTDDIIDPNDGLCSLREAVIAANANKVSGPVDGECLAGNAETIDEIILKSHVYALTIAGQNEEAAATGDLDITQGVIIAGTGAATTVIDAGQIDRVIESHGSAQMLTVRDLTLTNGKLGTNASGAGIYIHDHKATLERVKLSGNAGVSTLAVTYSPEFIVKDSQFTDNTAAQGGMGAMEIIGSTVHIEHCTFTDNFAYGGAQIVYLTYAGSLPSPPSLTITHSTIELVTKKDVTALSVNNALAQPVVVTISESRIIGNVTDDSGVVGVALRKAHATIRQSTIEKFGYGLVSFGNSNVQIIRSVLVDNKTYAAQVTDEKDTAEILNSTLTNNANGLVAHAGHVALRNVTMVNHPGGEAEGWLVNLQGGTFETQNSIFVGNHQACPIGAGSKGHNIVAASLADCPAFNQPGDLTEIGVAAVLHAAQYVDTGAAGGKYYPLSATSVAIGAGDPSACTEALDTAVDQLGAARLGTCDIGAIEAYCGDAIAHAPLGEECDDGNQNNADACLTTCKKAECGDGFIRIGAELCDDGNQVNDDACPNTCKSPTCGDGITQTANNEVCDDANDSNNDGCLKTCALAKCGDGFVQKGFEECDDANAVNTDVCLNICMAGKCGDAVVQAGVEACDDGNAVNDDDCSNACAVVQKSPVLPPDPTPVVLPVEPVEVKKDETKTEAPTPSETPAANGGCSLILR